MPPSQVNKFGITTTSFTNFISWPVGSANFFCTWTGANIFSLQIIISLPGLLSYNMKAAINNMQISGYGCVPITPYKDR